MPEAFGCRWDVLLYNWNTFLYGNPVAPLVVAFVAGVILGSYWLSRCEISSGERPEGPAASHPAALLVQAVLVLLRDWRLAGLVALWVILQRGSGWIMHGLPERAASWLLGSVNADALFVAITQGETALTAVHHSLPNAFWLLALGPLTLPGAALISLILLVMRQRQPGWMSPERGRNAALIGLGCLALTAVSVADMSGQIARSATGDDSGILRDTALLLASVPLWALVNLFPLAALYELSRRRAWTLGEVLRRTVDGYWPWLAWCVLMALPTALSAALHHGEAAWMMHWPDLLLSALRSWAPVLFFAFPWVLLERRLGVGEAFLRSLRVLTGRPGLVLCFAARFAACLLPAHFGLLVLQAGVSRDSLPDALITALGAILSLVSGLAVCSAIPSFQSSTPAGEPALAEE